MAGEAPEGSEALQIADFRSRFTEEESKEILEHVVQCQYGLIDKIISEKIFNRRQLAGVKNPNKDSYEQNAALFDLLVKLTDKATIDKFMLALTETSQGHVSNFILSSGAIPDGNRPLTKEECEALDSCQDFVKDNLYITASFIPGLLEAGCITMRHKTGIEEFNANQDKMLEVLLDILHCRSIAHVNQFAQWCKKDHPHVEEVLSGKGGFVSLDCIIKVDPASERKNVETVIITEMRKMSKEELKALESIVKKEHNQESDLELAGSAPHKSIRLYFYTPSLKALREFRESIEKWGAIIESLFNLVLSRIQLGPVSVTYIYLNNYCKCEQYLMKKESLQQIKYESSTTVQDIISCTDIFEKILLKAFVLQSVAAKKISSRPRKTAYQTLCFVCKDWRRAATKRKWFSNTLKKCLQQYDNYEAEKHHFMTFEDEVRGVSVKDNKLYIVHGLQSDTIQEYEYDLSGYGYIRDIKVAGTKEVHIQDIATCQSSDSIYASDSSNECVWRITLDVKAENNEQMPITAEQVSLTQTGQLLTLSDEPPMLAICYDQRDTRHAVSRSYVLIGRHFENPQHVIQLKESDNSIFYLISHGRESGRPHRICMISDLGDIQATYGDICGGGIGELNYPCHMATDIEGHIYVADAGNKRVLMLDNDLRLLQVLLTEEDDGVTNPKRLCYSVEHNQLFVASDNKLSIYSIRQRAQHGKLSAQQSTASEHTKMDTT